MTEGQRIRDKAVKYLDTHDKRWMFLKIFFPNLVAHIGLEGSPINTCFNIIRVMQSRELLHEFENKLIEVFEKE